MAEAYMVNGEPINTITITPESHRKGAYLFAVLNHFGAFIWDFESRVCSISLYRRENLNFHSDQTPLNHHNINKLVVVDHLLNLPHFTQKLMKYQKPWNFRAIKLDIWAGS